MEYITTLWQLLHTLDNNIFFQYSVYDNHIWLYIQTHPLACHLLQLILTVCNVILAHKTSMLLSTLASLTVCLCLSSSAHAWMSLTRSLHDYTSVCKCMSLNVCNACQCPVRVSLCVCLCVCVRVCSMRWQTDRQKSQAGRKMCSLKISVLFWHVSSFSAPRQPPLLKHSCPTERQQRVHQLINEGNSGKTWMFRKMSCDPTLCVFNRRRLCS